MDPLSITCGIITISGVVLGSLKILSTVLGASDEGIALMNEVTDLQVVLRDVQSILEGSKKAEIESLQSALAKLNKSVLLLHDFIHTRLLKEEDLDNVRISKLVWIYERTHIMRYQRELKSLRAELTTALSIANLSVGSRIELSVASIVALSNETKEFLAEQGAYNKNLAEEIRNLKHLWFLDPRRLRWKKGASPSTPSDGTRTPNSVFFDERQVLTDENKGLEVQLVWRPKFICNSECYCDCHQTKQARSPQVLDKFLGALFIGYTSLPLLRPGCNISACHRQKSQGLKLTWYFPTWFVKRMIAFTYMHKPGNGLQVSLKVARIVDNGAPIFALTQLGDLNGIKLLLAQQQASPLDAGHLDGFTPLHFAVQRGHTHLVEFLVKSGADKDAANNWFDTPRVLAWRIILQRTKRKDVIKSYQQLFPMDMEEFGFSLLHEIITEVKHGELKNAVMKLPAAIDKVDYEERTPLMWASVRCNKAAIDVLLKYGADPLLHDKNGNTALYFAALGGSIECVKALIKAGAKLQKGYVGLDPIHRACDTHDDVDLVAALLRLPHDINSKDSFSRSYLGTAAWRNHYKSLAYLLEQGADYEALDAFNATPLLRAAKYGAVEAAEVLLKFGVNVLAKDKSQQTILHRAAASRSERMIEFLADKAAEKLAMVDVESKDIGNMTARERLHELEPTAKLLAAFTRLIAAISQAKADIDLAKLERTLLPEYNFESEKEDEDIFFDTFESVDFMITTPSILALAV